MIDSSNHKDIQIVPLIVLYLDIEKGIKVKLLELKDLPSETSEKLNEYVFNTLSNLNIVSKFIGWSACNFGGLNRQGKNYLFYKLNNSCSKFIVGVGIQCNIYKHIY